MIIGVDARAANNTVRVGVGNYCAETLREMVHFQGTAALRVYLDRPPVADFPLDSGMADIRVLPAGKAWTQRALRRELATAPPDVFFAPLGQLPLWLPCPAVSAIHDLACFEFGGYFDWTRRWRARLGLRNAIYRSARLCAISQATKDDVVRRFGVPPDRITVTLLAASAGFRPCSDPERIARVRACHGLPERYFLYVGRLQPRKNLERLIDAFGLACARHPELGHGLVLAGGPGWMYDHIHARARSSPVSGRIQFLGHVPGEDLPVLMGQADALALVSLWEGFGIPVIEAMACGTAVLTSNCSSLPEVAGDAALLVDPRNVEAMADALADLATDDGLRRSLEQRGLVRAGEFTWGKCAQRTMQALLQAANA